MSLKNFMRTDLTPEEVKEYLEMVAEFEADKNDFEIYEMTAKWSDVDNQWSLWKDGEVVCQRGTRETLVIASKRFRD